jgi:hypothetical protein
MDYDRFEEHDDSSGDGWYGEQAADIVSDLVVGAPGLNGDEADDLIAECADEFGIGDHMDWSPDGTEKLVRCFDRAAAQSPLHTRTRWKRRVFVFGSDGGPVACKRFGKRLVL